MRLLIAWNIIIDLVLPFIFSNGRRLWDCRFHNTVFEVEGASKEETTYPRLVF
jgi:hypothetical protein